MRNLVLAILAIGAASIAGHAAVQTYAPNYPVCLHVYGPATYYECRYTSRAQMQCVGIGPRRPVPRQLAASSMKMILANRVMDAQDVSLGRSQNGNFREQHWSDTLSSIDQHLNCKPPFRSVAL
jgi:hypothetical protein